MCSVRSGAGPSGSGGRRPALRTSHPSRDVGGGSGLGGAACPTHLRKHRNRMAKLRSGYVVQLGHHRRLAHVAEMRAGRFRQSEPVMPIAQHVLQALKPGEEVPGFSRRLGELGRVARPLAQDAILVQQPFGDRRVPVVNPFQHPFWRLPKGPGSLPGESSCWRVSAASESRRRRLPRRLSAVSFPAGGGVRSDDSPGASFAAARGAFSECVKPSTARPDRALCRRACGFGPAASAASFGYGPASEKARPVGSEGGARPCGSDGRSLPEVLRKA
jgi:hypothetical protein